MKATGRYYHSVNGEDLRVEENIIPTEGIHHFLNTVLNSGTPITAWYLGLFQGNATPVAGWTAANFTANSTENTSETDGYTGVNRLVWTPSAAAAGGKIGNLSNVATFTFVTTGPLVIYGAGLLSAQARGATTGTLLSSLRFAQSRTLNNGDTLQLGYEVELTDS